MHKKTISLQQKLLALHQPKLREVILLFNIKSCTEYSIRILFGPDSRPNGVFVFS